MPERLRGYLVDLRLLRGLPLAYLVPDARLLPPESMRFFELDLTWVDRVVEGVLNAASIGTVEFTYGASLMTLIRTALDGDLADIAAADVPGATWSLVPGEFITGMLMRSQVTRRWPDLRVVASADSTPVPILRSEAISRDIHIALFAGRPTTVEIREPYVGARFGVELKDAGSATEHFEVDARNSDGSDRLLAPSDSPAKIVVGWADRRRRASSTSRSSRRAGSRCSDRTVRSVWHCTSSSARSCRSSSTSNQSGRGRSRFPTVPCTLRGGTRKIDVTELLERRLQAEAVKQP